MPAVLEIQVEVREYPLSSHLNLQRLTKPKRVWAPLNEAVRESLCGNSTAHVDRMASETPYSTSGSDHDIDSMAPGFLEEREEDGAYTTSSRPDFSDDYGSDVESAGARGSNPFHGHQIRETLQGVLYSCTKLEQMLLRDVTDALRMAEEKPIEKRSLCRFVMSNLRSRGYNAGICKSRWEKTNGYPAGDHEFMDVVFEGSGSVSVGESDRLLVDMDFRAQFEIARPTEEYDAVVGAVPAVFVGRADKVRQMIRVMCDAARRSLKTQGMHVPPWRKGRYMQAKWLGPYKRTTNPLPSSHLLHENGAMAVGMGTAFDASFAHRMRMHFQQAMRETNNASRERVKEQVVEVPWDLQGNGRVAVKIQPSIMKFPLRGEAKTSGLATAMAAAGRSLEGVGCRDMTSWPP